MRSEETIKNIPGVLIAAFCILVGCGINEQGLGEDSSGVSIRIGEEFIIALDTDVTDGYSWRESHDPVMLELVGRTYKKGEHTKPELAGSTGGVEYFSYRGLKAGETEIIMICERPWKNETIEQKVFTINIQ